MGCYRHSLLLPAVKWRGFSVWSSYIGRDTHYREQVCRQGGIRLSQLLDETDLDRFDQVDLRKVLNQVAGVYIREEDGFGLRPNIGIRGAGRERSQKVTLMRDGVLITPAPYSAPAAYYVPNVSRIGSVEVLKGPSATPTAHTLLVAQSILGLCHCRLLARKGLPISALDLTVITSCKAPMV